jgi:hypothetical protein
MPESCCRSSWTLAGSDISRDRSRLIRLFATRQPSGGACDCPDSSSCDIQAVAGHFSSPCRNIRRNRCPRPGLLLLTPPCRAASYRGRGGMPRLPSLVRPARIEPAVTICMAALARHRNVRDCCPDRRRDWNGGNSIAVACRQRLDRDSTPRRRGGCGSGMPHHRVGVDPRIRLYGASI